MKKDIKLTSGGVPIKNMAEIFLDICRAYGFTAEELRGKSRAQMLVQARKAFARKAYVDCAASMYEIGVALGDRDSTTIFYYLHGGMKKA